MSDSRSHGLPSPGVCAGIVIAMLAMIAIPAAITLYAVHEPVPLVPVNQHSTPQVVLRERRPSASRPTIVDHVLSQSDVVQKPAYGKCGFRVPSARH
jgi:hypothetical protein